MLSAENMETTKLIGNIKYSDYTVCVGKAKAFSGEGVREHQFAVYNDGTVRVWDSVANHYTTCHSLSPEALIRIRNLATVA